MNGAWERMIGLARRILESLLYDSKYLTHEVLCTLMAEVVCIINSRPITTVSDDPTLPTILSPNMLLTHKENSDIAPRKDLGHTLFITLPYAAFHGMAPKCHIEGSMITAV
jgi:hypothetical protein